MTKTFSKENRKLLDVTIVRAKDKISTELDGETVILDVSSGVYSGLDSVGTIIWNLLETPISVRRIVEKVQRDFDVEEDECITDLIDFLKSLYENALIVIQDAED